MVMLIRSGLWNYKHQLVSRWHWWLNSHWSLLEGSSVVVLEKRTAMCREGSGENRAEFRMCRYWIVEGSRFGRDYQQFVRIFNSQFQIWWTCFEFLDPHERARNAQFLRGLLNRSDLFRAFLALYKTRYLSPEYVNPSLSRGHKVKTEVSARCT